MPDSVLVGQTEMVRLSDSDNESLDAHTNNAQTAH